MVNRAYLFEGAVMDGVPIFSLAADTMPGLRALEFRGAVNTTCAFILTEMERGVPFAAISGDGNALYLSTDVLGEIGIVQRSGSLTHTAYALVADLARISRRLMERTPA